MISYKRDILEGQSLSEVKMGKRLSNLLKSAYKYFCGILNRE